MMPKGKIGLWMYADSNGKMIQEKLKNKLESADLFVINNFDMRTCYCMNGRVYTAEGFDLSNLDVLYHMNADEQTPFQRNILRAIELSGVTVINSFSSFDLASDKFAANLCLRNNNIRVAPSVLIGPNYNRELINEIFQEWKSVVVKPRYSFGGKGIIKFDNVEQFIDFTIATKTYYEDFYFEKFIPFSECDYRVEIFNDKYIGSYSRKLIHSYKTNMSATDIINKKTFLRNPPEEEQIKIALNASRTLGLTTTIVDMVRSHEDNQLYVIEVNCMMGIFVQAANQILKIDTASDDAYKYASDENKFDQLANYLIGITLDRARSHIEHMSSEHSISPTHTEFKKAPAV